MVKQGAKQRDRKTLLGLCSSATFCYLFQLC